MFKEMHNALDEMPEQNEAPVSVEDAVGKACTYVPVVVKILNIAKFFTGSKADAKIDSIIVWLQTLCGEKA